MRKGIALTGIIALIGLASCGKYNYAPALTDDQKKAKPEIYGEVGGVARQTKNTYPDNPAATGKALELKQKLRETKN